MPKELTPEDFYNLFDKYNIWGMKGMPTREMMNGPQAQIKIVPGEIVLFWIWDYGVHYKKKIKMRDILDTAEFYNIFK